MMMAVDWRHILMLEIVVLAWLSWRWVRLKGDKRA